MIMTANQSIDVQRFIDARGLSPAQVLLLVLCFLVVAVDGFDTIAIAFIAPALQAEWGVTPAQLAPLFGAGHTGLMIGAFAFGPLADRLAANLATAGLARFEVSIEWSGLRRRGARLVALVSPKDLD